MYRGKRIVAFTPFGRERTCSILAIYLAREQQRGILDEWMLCMNTDERGQEGDRAWAENVESILPWVKRYARPDKGHHVEGMPAEWGMGPRKPKQMNTGRFFIYMQDRDTIYIRFDDDIIWIERDAITNMVDALFDNGAFDPNGKVLAVFPVIWNNAQSSWYLQRNGHIPPEYGRCSPNAVDPVGWGSPKFAEKIHNLLLEHIAHGNERLTFIDKPHWLGPREQFSVSCFAIPGGVYADIGGVITWDEEEHWLTQHHTGNIHRQNLICGRAAVAHYTFFTQSSYINKTDILHRYWQLAQQVQARLDAGEYTPDIQPVSSPPAESQAVAD